MIVLRSDRSFVDEKDMNEMQSLEKEGHIFSRIGSKIDELICSKLFPEEETQKSLVEVSMLRTNWVFRETKSSIDKNNED